MRRRWPVRAGKGAASPGRAAMALVLLALMAIPWPTAGGTAPDGGPLAEGTVVTVAPGKAATLHVTIPSDATPTGAELRVSGLQGGAAGTWPLYPSVDIGGDGTVEWAFGGQGYGPLGRQEVFSGGGASVGFVAPGSPAHVKLPVTAVPGNGTVRVRALLGDPSVTATFPVAPSPRSLLFDSAGRRLFAGAYGVDVIDALTGGVRPVSTSARSPLSSNSVSALVLDPGAGVLYAGTRSDGVTSLDLATGRAWWYGWSGELADRRVTALAIGGQTLFVGHERAVTILDTAAGKGRFIDDRSTPPLADGIVSSLAYDGSSSLLFIGLRSGPLAGGEWVDTPDILQVYNISSGASKVLTAPGPGWTTSVALDAGRGRAAAAGTGSNGLLIYDYRNGREVRFDTSSVPPLLAANPAGVVLDPSSGAALVYYQSGAVQVLDLANRTSRQYSAAAIAGTVGGLWAAAPDWAGGRLYLSSDTAVGYLDLATGLATVVHRYDTLYYHDALIAEAGSGRVVAGGLGGVRAFLPGGARAGINISGTVGSVASGPGGEIFVVNDGYSILRLNLSSQSVEPVVSAGSPPLRYAGGAVVGNIRKVLYDAARDRLLLLRADDASGRYGEVAVYDIRNGTAVHLNRTTSPPVATGREPDLSFDPARRLLATSGDGGAALTDMSGGTTAFFTTFPSSNSEGRRVFLDSGKLVYLERETAAGGAMRDRVGVVNLTSGGTAFYDSATSPPLPSMLLAPEALYYGGAEDAVFIAHPTKGLFRLSLSPRPAVVYYRDLPQADLGSIERLTGAPGGGALYLDDGVQVAAVDLFKQMPSVSLDIGGPGRAVWTASGWLVDAAVPLPPDALASAMNSLSPRTDLYGNRMVEVPLAVSAPPGAQVEMRELRIEYGYDAAVDALPALATALPRSAGPSPASIPVLFSAKGDGALRVAQFSLAYTENNPPVARIIAPPPGAEIAAIRGRPVTLRGEAVDSDGTVRRSVWESSLDGPLGEGNELTLTGLSGGLHEFTFTAVDDRGRWSEPARARVTVAARVPGLNLSAPPYLEGRPGAVSMLNFTLSNTGNDADAVAYEVYSSGGWPLSTSGGESALPAGGTRSIPVNVTMPRTAAPGTSGRVTLIVRSKADGSELIASTEVAVPGTPAPHPAGPVVKGRDIVVVGASSSLMGALAFLFIGTERGKFGLFTLLVPLYTKLRREDVMSNELRGVIRGFITANPGEHYNHIRRRLGLSNGVLTYHLRVLEREQFIRTKAVGRYKYFFPWDYQIPPLFHRLTKVEQFIHAAVREQPGITRKELATLLGLPPSTVGDNLARLVWKGILRVEHEGGRARCYLDEERGNT